MVCPWEVLGAGEKEEREKDTRVYKLTWARSAAREKSWEMKSLRK